MSPVPTREQVAIDRGERSYRILIGSGLLADVATWADAPTSSQALVVTNTTVAPLYAQALVRTIAARHKQVHVVELPDGEQHKNWQVLNRIFD